MQIWDPDPGWKTWIIFLRAEKPFILVKILSQISKTGNFVAKFKLKEPNNNRTLCGKGILG
jgi:hypothetical protein